MGLTRAQWITAVLATLGAVLVTVGLEHAWAPLGWIAPGVFLLAVAFDLDRKGGG